MIEALFEALFYVFSEAFLTAVFYWPGWLVLRIVTLGRYPPPNGTPHDNVFVAIVGFITPLVLLTVALTN